jgi:hypothetical protein
VKPAGHRQAPAGNVQAGVGACKMGSCGFNNDLECTAGSITVGLVDENVECLTYMMR